MEIVNTKINVHMNHVICFKINGTTIMENLFYVFLRSNEQGFKLTKQYNLITEKETKLTFVRLNTIWNLYLTFIALTYVSYDHFISLQCAVK